MYSNCRYEVFVRFSSRWKPGQYVVEAVQINSPKSSLFRVACWFDFANFITEKKFTAICCAIHRNELYTGILNSGYSLSRTCRQKLSVEWHWLVFLTQILLHFGQLFFYSRQVCNKRLANWPAITDTLTLNGFTRNAKHGFNSWKWSNLALNSCSSLTICFGILPFCGLQMPLRENTDSHSDIGKMTECFWQYVSLYNFNFLLGRKLA